jgi:hypothetical protein
MKEIRVLSIDRNILTAEKQRIGEKIFPLPIYKNST